MTYQLHRHRLSLNLYITSFPCHTDVNSRNNHYWHNNYKQKWNEAGSSVETWVDLEPVIQNEVSQKERERKKKTKKTKKHCILTHIRRIWASSPGVQMVMNLPVVQETGFDSWVGKIP